MCHHARSPLIGELANFLTYCAALIRSVKRIPCKFINTNKLAGSSLLVLMSIFFTFISESSKKKTSGNAPSVCLHTALHLLAERLVKAPVLNQSTPVIRFTFWKGNSGSASTRAVQRQQRCFRCPSWLKNGKKHFSPKLFRKFKFQKNGKRAECH